ncbi:hypothetical protein ACFYKX_10240 [Cytobacillus sp. FJAT-54145]|uniref:Uncharacterized protein n=1 Tax=Cytobacillus spartinae TaxID=3299023 RepID=A0ABW6K9Y6_9BACI
MIQKNHLYNEANWGVLLQDVCAVVQDPSQEIAFTKHFRHESLKNRKLRLQEVWSIFRNGSAQIIQGHARGHYAIRKGCLNEDELYVFFGKMTSDKAWKRNKPVHVVLAKTSDGKYKFVSVYFPSLTYFEADYKTLRPEFVGKSFVME